MRPYATALTLLLLGALSASAQEGRLIPNPIRNIPAWVRSDFAAKNMDEHYTITYAMFPYTLRGDFNGDERRDVVIQIVEKRSGKAGIAIFHARRPQAIYTNVTILGAGKPLGSAGDDFKWANTWNMVPLKKLPSSGIKGVADAQGDLLVLERRGSTKGAVYFDGKRYSWQRLKP
jgi:hypothetical protein